MKVDHLFENNSKVYANIYFSVTVSGKPDILILAIKDNTYMPYSGKFLTDGSSLRNHKLNINIKPIITLPLDQIPLWSRTDGGTAMLHIIQKVLSRDTFEVFVDYNGTVIRSRIADNEEKAEIEQFIKSFTVFDARLLFSELQALRSLYLKNDS